MTEQPDHWETPQNILVVLAHPDDPEFFCGATLARWAHAGHKITYLLLTCGDKGFNDTTPADMTTDKLCSIRHEEQANAAKVIGAQAVHWLDHPDGYLVPDLDLRRDVVARSGASSQIFSLHPIRKIYLLDTASIILITAPPVKPRWMRFFLPRETKPISQKSHWKDSSRIR